MNRNRIFDAENHLSGVTCLVLLPLLVACSIGITGTPPATKSTTIDSSQLMNTDYPFQSQYGTDTMTPRLENRTYQNQTEVIPTYSPQNRLIKIASGTIGDIRWSENSDSLFYSTFEEGKTENWVYEIDSGEIKNINPPQSPAEISLSSEAVQVGRSPSGMSAIYLLLLEPPPTAPQSEDGGEFWRGGGRAELWVWQNGETRKIADTIHCAYYYKWSDDEQMVIANPQGEGSCRENPIWLINLKKGSITSLLKSKKGFEYFLPDISPDNRYLIYIDDHKLYLFDVQGDESKLILDRQEMLLNNAEWIDNRKALITFVNKNGMSWGIGYIEMKDFIPSQIIQSQLYEQLKGNSLSGAYLSPDEGRLAFKTEQIGSGIESLWIFGVEDK